MVEIIEQFASISKKQEEIDSTSTLFEGKDQKPSRTVITIIPSMPICDIGRSKSALRLKIAKTVAAIENTAKRMVTMPVVREKASKPGKERKVTDAFNITAALRQGRSVASKGEKGDGHTTRKVHAPMSSVGVA